MIEKRTNRTAEWTRNILLILFAVGVVVVFFNLDAVKKGESVFSNQANRQLKFTGDLGRRDFSEKELNQLYDYIKIRKKFIEEVKIEASPQDSYKKITSRTEILFEVHVTMKDGFTFSTPLRRTSRGHLATNILAKMDKDVRAYLDLKKRGSKAKSMINTM